MNAPDRSAAAVSSVSERQGGGGKRRLEMVIALVKSKGAVWPAALRPGFGCADNGLALVSHGLLGKQSVFEHSMRTPLIMSGPGIPKNKSSFAFTYLLDLFPTLCDVLSVQPPGGLEGESLKPLWKSSLTRVRDSVFLPYLDIQRAVRDEGWKLIAYPKIGYLQLFDLALDPDETTNLIARPDLAHHTERLRAMMQRWQTLVGDTVPIPAANKAPPKIDLTSKQRAPDQWQPGWIIQKYFGPQP